MAEFIAMHYLVFKALHVISIIAWMAGLLYLPRIFAYHAAAGNDAAIGETFDVMEHRLLRYIMNPAMIAAWVFGLLMLWGNPALLENAWMHVKLTAVVLITILHHVYAKWRKVFARRENTRPAGFYKIWNEVPTVLMIIIVFMAVAEPF